MQVCRSSYPHDTKCDIDMKHKRRPSCIVYKYVEVPHLTSLAPTEELKPRSPKESLAYRAWANCYQPPTVHFDLPSPTSPASTTSTTSSRSSPISSLHSSNTSTSAHGYAATSAPCLAKPSTLRTKPSTPASAPMRPVLKTRAYSSPESLTKQKANPHRPLPTLSRLSTRPTETLYTTTTTTITTKNGTIVKERKVMSAHGFRDGKDGVEWKAFRSPDWEYPLHKKVKRKRVLASCPQLEVK